MRNNKLAKSAEDWIAWYLRRLIKRAIVAKAKQQ